MRPAPARRWWSRHSRCCRADGPTPGSSATAAARRGSRAPSASTASPASPRWSPTPGERSRRASAILARTLTAEGQGRSRAHLGGASVPASVLAALGERLVTVHGQSEQHRLRQPSAQREALDRFAGDSVGTLLADYRPAYTRLAQVRAELADLTARERERAREADALRLGVDEIAAAEPAAGEDDELRREEDRLAHAEALQAAAAQAHTALAGDAEAAEPGADVTGQARDRTVGAGGRTRPRPRAGRAGRPRRRAVLRRRRPRPRSGRLLRGRRGGPGPARRGAGAQGGAGRAHPQVRPHHRRRARLGRAVLAPAARAGQRRRRRSRRCGARPPTSPSGSLPWPRG